MDGDKGLNAKTFKKDVTFLFCRDWLSVFGQSRVTSKEVTVGSPRSFSVGVV